MRLLRDHARNELLRAGLVDLYTVAGLAGVAGYVAAYAMLQLGLLDGNGVRYSVANVVAAALVLVSLTDNFNLASALIQVIWIVVGVGGLALRAMRRRSAVHAMAGVNGGNLRADVVAAYEAASS